MQFQTPSSPYVLYLLYIVNEHKVNEKRKGDFMALVHMLAIRIEVLVLPHKDSIKDNKTHVSTVVEMGIGTVVTLKSPFLSCART